MSTVYRIQDAEGRGPFRPGLTAKWVDDIRPYNPPAFYEEFGASIIERINRSGLHCGSACASMDTLSRWFSRSERRRLKRLGFSVVAIEPDHIFAESEHQLVIGCERPLNKVGGTPRANR